MAQLFANNAVSLLNGTIGPGSVQMQVVDASVFPVITVPGDFFLVTLEDKQFRREIVKVTWTAGTLFNIERGQENTLPLTWYGEAHTIVDARNTADTMNRLAVVEESYDIHYIDYSLHLTAAQNTLLDGLSPTLTAIELNYIEGVTSAVQPQLDSKAPQATTYTMSQVDNAISSVITSLIWQQHVATYANIATTYPTPSDGWTVAVDDTGLVYRYDGVGLTWVAIKANTVPLATTVLDGLMSATDKTKLDSLTSTTFVHADGSVPFTAPQAGIDPVVASDLSTKNYVDNNVSSFNRTSVTSGGYTIQLTDQYVGINYAGFVVLQLPSGVNKHIVLIKDEGGYAGTYYVTVLPAVGETIEGEPDMIIQVSKFAIELYFNGTNWNII